MSGFHENGTVVTSSNPVRCPSCQQLKHKLVFRSCGSRCLDCENADSPLQTLLENAAATLPSWAEDAARENRIRDYYFELREWRKLKREERLGNNPVLVDPWGSAI